MTTSQAQRFYLALVEEPTALATVPQPQYQGLFVEPPSRVEDETEESGSPL
ncbi:hypothetical protein [Streptomyces sp. ADI95-16]|uniref:hypothetical protein n=1 Tax=Streptomyces sp. ADI95-16 TaxID=1522758 RepID=UPI0013DE40ED|nr:hypothetical protein [Streptomyces sp. ADI95-16]